MSEMTGMHTCVCLQAMLLLPASAKLPSHKQSARWVCTYIDSPARRDCEAASQRNCLKTQDHLATSTVMPVVRLTCCQHLPKLPTDSLLQDRSSCQFGELFRKHKLVFTGPVWIAGHVAPLNKCRTVNSSKLQVTMISSKPTYMHCELTSPEFTDNGSKHPKPSELRWVQCPWL